MIRGLDGRAAWAVRLALFAVCAWVSGEQMDERWVIGPLFGVVVLAWHLTLPPTLTLQHALFLVASTLIYALVAHLAIDGLPVAQHSMEVNQAVLVGTVLLPVAHRQFLGAPWDRVVRTIVGVYVVWFAIGKLLEMMDLDGTWGLINMASIWQALYLSFMFAPWPWIRRRAAA